MFLKLNLTTPLEISDNCITELVHESITKLKNELLPFYQELEPLVEHSTTAREGFNPGINEINQLLEHQSMISPTGNGLLVYYSQKKVLGVKLSEKIKAF